MTITSAAHDANRVHPTLYPAPEGREIARFISTIGRKVP